MPTTMRWLAAIVILSGCGGSAPPPANSSSANSTEATTTQTNLALQSSAEAPPSGTTPIAKPSQPIPGASDPSPPNQVAEVPEPEDLSLSVDEYQKLGIPSIRRPWNSLDMTKAAKVLAEIAVDDPARLPRYNSPKSGKVFARMTSDDNLEQLRTSKIPAALRLPSGLQFMQASSSFGKSYATGLLKRKTGGDEAAELVGLNLRIAVAMSGLAEEIVMSLDKKDPSFTKRIGGMKEVQSGLSTILQSAILQASETKALNSGATRRLLAILDETLPTLIRAVPPAVRKETLAKLREMSEKPEFEKHKKLLDPILDKIEKAIEDTSEE